VRTLHFDCFAGISGDMALGAFVDLGVDPNVLIAELKKLGLKGWALRFERDERCGITGVHAIVHVHPTPARRGHLIETGQPSHNSWKEIRAIIEAAPL
jgi:uncharacterized protein (DUF111 family)